MTSIDPAQRKSETLLKVSFNRTILGSDRERGFEVGTCKLRAGDMQAPVIEYRSERWGKEREDGKEGISL